MEQQMDTFNDRVDNLFTFYKAYNRFPRDSTNIPDFEQTLASFRNKLKQAHKQIQKGLKPTHYALTAERMHVIQKYIDEIQQETGHSIQFWCDTEDAEFREKVQRVKSFRDMHGFYPKHKQDLGKTELSVINTWRMQYVKGTLAQSRIDYILQQLPDFLFKVQHTAREQNVLDLIVFVQEHKRPPMQKENKKLQTFHKDVLSGKVSLSVDLKDKLEEALATISN